jgi:hypothetical protein
MTLSLIAVGPWPMRGPQPDSARCPPGEAEQHLDVQYAAVKRLAG